MKRTFDFLKSIVKNISIKQDLTEEERYKKTLEAVKKGETDLAYHAYLIDGDFREKPIF